MLTQMIQSCNGGFLQLSGFAECYDRFQQSIHQTVHKTKGILRLCSPSRKDGTTSIDNWPIVRVHCHTANNDLVSERVRHDGSIFVVAARVVIGRRTFSTNSGVVVVAAAGQLNFLPKKFRVLVNLLTGRNVGQQVLHMNHPERASRRLLSRESLGLSPCCHAIGFDQLRLTAIAILGSSARKPIGCRFLASYGRCPVVGASISQ